MDLRDKWVQTAGHVEALHQHYFFVMLFKFCTIHSLWSWLGRPDRTVKVKTRVRWWRGQPADWMWTVSVPCGTRADSVTILGWRMMYQVRSITANVLITLKPAINLDKVFSCFQVLSFIFPPIAKWSGPSWCLVLLVNMSHIINGNHLGQPDNPQDESHMTQVVWGPFRIGISLLFSALPDSKSLWHILQVEVSQVHFKMWPPWDLLVSWSRLPPKVQQFAFKLKSPVSGVRYLHGHSKFHDQQKQFGCRILYLWWKWKNPGIDHQYAACGPGNFQFAGHSLFLHMGSSVSLVGVSVSLVLDKMGMNFVCRRNYTILKRRQVW